jgi:hypothetical protein
MSLLKSTIEILMLCAKAEFTENLQTPNKLATSADQHSLHVIEEIRCTYENYNS